MLEAGQRLVGGDLAARLEYFNVGLFSFASINSMRAAFELLSVFNAALLVCDHLSSRFYSIKEKSE